MGINGNVRFVITLTATMLLFPVETLVAQTGALQVVDSGGRVLGTVVASQHDQANNGYPITTVARLIGTVRVGIPVTRDAILITGGGTLVWYTSSDCSGPRLVEANQPLRMAFVLSDPFGKPTTAVYPANPIEHLTVNSFQVVAASDGTLGPCDNSSPGQRWMGRAAAFSVKAFTAPFDVQ